MTQQDLISILANNRPDMVRLFGIKKIGIFGSAARNDMHEDSDIDVLVEFQSAPTFDAYMDLKFYLENLFHKSVDLVIDDTVKPRMRPLIEKDLICVA